MFKTIKYSKTNKPLIDINEQGVVYCYKTRQLKYLRQMERNCCPYYYWSEGNKTYYVHIEVAKAFPEICGKWFKGCEVHHKDGNSLNNEATNLVVCTKAQHMEYHRKMKRNNERKKYLKTSSFDDKLDEFKKNGEFSVTYYCRKSKKNKDGLAPIEIGINQKGERRFKNSGFMWNPDEFEKGNYPEGFMEYVNGLLND